MPARRYAGHHESPSSSLVSAVGAWDWGVQGHGRVKIKDLERWCGAGTRRAQRRRHERRNHAQGIKGTETKQILTRALQVVIIQPVDNGNKTHPYGHALVAGIERYPSKITRRMSKTRQEKRSKVKPFIKVINYNHLMPTRYTLELEGLKAVLNADTFKEVSQREDAKKTVKKVLEERYTSGKNRWFFTPLRSSPPLSPCHE